MFSHGVRGTLVSQLLMLSPDLPKILIPYVHSGEVNFWCLPKSQVHYVQSWGGGGGLHWLPNFWCWVQICPKFKFPVHCMGGGGFNFWCLGWIQIYLKPKLPMSGGDGRLTSQPLLLSPHLPKTQIPYVHWKGKVNLLTFDTESTSAWNWNSLCSVVGEG